MEQDELLRRAEDLAARAARSGTVTHTVFLTPAEQHALRARAAHAPTETVFSGGYPDAERQVAFFLPEWMDADDFDPAEALCAIELTVRFGAPGHRDVLGAALALGVERDRLGDILVDGERAWLFCLPTVKEHLLRSLDRVGRWGAQAREISPAEVPAPKREVRPVEFSVQSARLDAVCAGVFRLSRGKAAEAIAAGLVQLNYAVCLKPDAPVRSGDVISVRGRGKAAVTDAGAQHSRKGRLFVRAEIAK